MAGTEAASAVKKLHSVMWIYSEQSRWFNVIIVTLMEIAASLHENVTDLDCSLCVGARPLNGNDLPNSYFL